jgi:hypothetical protein
MPVTTSTAISTLRTLRRIEQARETPSRPEPGCALWVSGTSDICPQEGRPLGDVKTIGRWPRRCHPRRCRSASSEPVAGTTWARPLRISMRRALQFSQSVLLAKVVALGEPPRRRRDKRHVGAGRFAAVQVRDRRLGAAWWWRVRPGLCVMQPRAMSADVHACRKVALRAAPFEILRTRLVRPRANLSPTIRDHFVITAVPCHRARGQHLFAWLRFATAPCPRPPRRQLATPCSPAADPNPSSYAR